MNGTERFNLLKEVFKGKCMSHTKFLGGTKGSVKIEMK